MADGRGEGKFQIATTSNHHRTDIYYLNTITGELWAKSRSNSSMWVKMANPMEQACKKGG